jgi:hypothetical protein
MTLCDLRPFDATRAGDGVRLRAEADRAAGVLSLRYELEGSLARWAIPEAASKVLRRERLWEATCFEAFVAPAGDTRYWELNLSPAGHWNVYRFDAYRRGMRLEPRVQPPVQDVVTDGTGFLTLTCTLDLGPVHEIARHEVEVALAAVLAEPDGARSFWALRHDAATPDFHLRESFALRLPPQYGDGL